MKRSKTAEKLIEKLNLKASAELDQRVHSEISKALTQAKQTESARTTPNIWRIIMKNRITRITVAASVIFAVALVMYLSNGAVDLTTVAFADIAQAMKEVPWMHQIGKGFERGARDSDEHWFAFDAKVHATKRADGKAIFVDVKGHKKFTYDPLSHTITIDYVEDHYPLFLSSPVSLLEDMLTRYKERGDQILTRKTRYNGQRAQLQEISSSSVGRNNSESHTQRFYIQPASKLLLAIQVMGTDAQGAIIMEGEITFSYPNTGPSDIYDLSVPRDAGIVNNLPEERYQQIWEAYRQSRTNATRQYAAVITYADGPFESNGQLLNDMITMVDIDFKSNRNHRHERHFVFSRGQSYDKFWPKYKEQLGDSFESLLAWTMNHYNANAYISVYVYDGKYDTSIRKGQGGNWGKPSKNIYSPERNFMPNTDLGSLAFPRIGKTGRIVEDDYARTNNLICIERLRQGIVDSENVTLPARILFYLDPQKNYLCVRQITERRPNAEWHEDKDWLTGVEQDKVRDGSITVKDITDFIQSTDGLWYPKKIVRKTTGVRPNYKDAPLKISIVITVYLQTSPEFPSGTFDTEHLLPADTTGGLSVK